MEEGVGIHDWELLHGSGAAPLTSGAAPAAEVDDFLGIEGESNGVIKSDYFSLDSESRYGLQVISDGDGEGDSLPDSDNPSWVDPESDSRFIGEPSAVAASGFPRADAGGFWTSDESSDEQEETAPEGDLFDGASSQSGLALEAVNFEIGEAEEVWDFEGIVDGSDESGDLNSEDSPTGEEDNPRSGDLGDFSAGEREKSEMPWWKLPVELLKFCVFRIRPVWSVSIAAALVSLVLLRRRLYKKKPKIKSVPINLSADDKKASQFMVRASRLNEAFSVVKRVPMIRSTLPTMGVTPWPVMALR
ncbi:unnamed protein product [Spirodela intermedia]|uniref:DUF6821 domain-containing protein n=1 Tax=Spirodela intermedia TaxID=51605 RepID=A0A7I8KRH3_SPIIN|nr:unnamed protein product [Spirodela intermedia]